MHIEVLEPGTEPILTALSATLSDVAPGMYLAGGTALALQLGHRISVDLDYFSPDPLPPQLDELIARAGEAHVVAREPRTLHAVIGNVQASFFQYQYPLIGEVAQEGSVRLASIEDIAAMKIDAASSRGSKKDFVDLFFLLREHTISELISWFEAKYAHVSFNRAHILKSLVYFEDAEHEPMPRMLIPVSWDEVKERLVKEATGFLNA